MGNDPDELLGKMKNNPNGIRFSELTKICDAYFGQARQSGGSHRIYKTLWAGDPRINIQNSRGKAKAYQIKQVLSAIEKLNRDKNE